MVDRITGQRHVLVFGDEVPEEEKREVVFRTGPAAGSSLSGCRIQKGRSQDTVIKVPLSIASGNKTEFNRRSLHILRITWKMSFPARISGTRHSVIRGLDTYRIMVRREPCQPYIVHIFKMETQQAFCADDSNPEPD